MASAIPQTAVCKHFCSPTRGGAQSAQGKGLGEAAEGGVGKEDGGGGGMGGIFSLEQNNNTGRRRPCDGNIPSGG